MFYLLRRIIRFLLPILVLLIGLFFFAKRLDKEVTSCLRNSNLDKYDVWNSIFNGTASSDIIILGASRAQQHIDPHIFEEISGKKAYNIGGEGGWFIELMKARFYTYLKYNKKPKILIFSLDYFMLFKPILLQDKYQFLPYLSDDSILSLTKKFNGDLSWADYNLPFVRYIDNSKALGDYYNSKYNKENILSSKYKGFRSFDLSWKDDLKKAKDSVLSINLDFNQAYITSFISFIEDLKNRNIKIVFVYSPEYIEGQNFVKNRTVLFDLYRKVSNKYDIPFYDYTKDSMSFQKQYFYNSNHLNTKGVQLFTIKFASELVLNQDLFTKD